MVFGVILYRASRGFPRAAICVSMSRIMVHHRSYIMCSINRYTSSYRLYYFVFTIPFLEAQRSTGELFRSTAKFLIYCIPKEKLFHHYSCHINIFDVCSIISHTLCNILYIRIRVDCTHFHVLQMKKSDLVCRILNIIC